MNIQFLRLKFQQRKYRSQRGAAAVELAIILPLIMMMLAGITEFSRAFWYYNALDKATRDAARYLSALPTAEMATTSTRTSRFATARNLVAAAASDPDSGAQVRPAITPANVEVSCEPTSCISPISITVNIVNFQMESAIPFVLLDVGRFGLSPMPSTTMPFMNY
ncbi:MAG: TadE/TadG family type IV pilus assembly protein [Burkholderiales bacterium]